MDNNCLGGCLCNFGCATVVRRGEEDGTYPDLKFTKISRNIAVTGSKFVGSLAVGIGHIAG